MKNLKTLNNKVTIDLLNHLLDKINDNILTDENFDDWHHYAFNEDYFIVGYYSCSEWLKSNNINAFNALEMICEYEKDHFGETTFCDGKINSESTVNMLAYILGEELLYELCNYDTITVNELKKRIEDMLN